VFRKADGRVIVACFSSHVHRVQQVLDAAQAHRRKVAFIGRSMVRNMGIARDLGYLRIPAGLIADMKDIENLPPDEVVLVSTGSQGEPMSALSRMASGAHQQVKIEDRDTIVLASSLIPGNESAVFRVINGLSQLGAHVVHKETALVHVSGHAPAGELLYVLNMTKPSNVMPIHGEWRHLRAHAELAVASGVPRDRVVLADDGVVVDLVDGKAKIVGAVPVGYVYVDGLAVGDIGEQELKDRLILGSDGFVSVFIVVDSVTGKVAAGPEVLARGFSEDAAAFEPVLPLIEAVLEQSVKEGVTERHELQQRVRRVVGKWVSDTYRRRPMIIPVVTEV
jgi:ribonuclease J